MKNLCTLLITVIVMGIIGVATLFNTIGASSDIITRHKEIEMDMLLAELDSEHKMTIENEKDVVELLKAVLHGIENDTLTEEEVLFVANNIASSEIIMSKEVNSFAIMTSSVIDTILNSNEIATATAIDTFSESVENLETLIKL